MYSGKQATPTRPTLKGTWFAVCALLASCEQQDVALAQADLIVDAFYSFDPVPLRAALDHAEQAGAVLYYQGWAKAAHYQIHQRDPCTRTAHVITCKITVVDDFGTTLGYTATDTFTMTSEQGKIQSVAFSGNDPPVFEDMLRWVRQHHPALIAKPCKDSFAGGSTPGACARAVVKGAQLFVATTSYRGDRP